VVTPASPSVGLGVVHLFWHLTSATDPEAVVAAVKDAEANGNQVVCVATLGHKADMAIMALGEDLWSLRHLQASLQATGLRLADSYVSVTELSEYSDGVPEAAKRARLYPHLPPEGKTAWCFYPMSKRREVGANWFTVPYEERKELMYEHGASGRSFAGRVVQLITGSAGLDDYEWGVTLFANHPDDLKEVVYTMRFDEASAIYAEFGPFVTGLVAPIEDVLAQIGGHGREP
jgi:chlorite dismutase